MEDDIVTPVFISLLPSSLKVYRKPLDKVRPTPAATPVTQPFSACRASHASGAYWFAFSLPRPSPHGQQVDVGVKCPVGS